jgi:hypothetical protein
MAVCLARFTGMYYSQLKAHTYEELIGIVLGPRFYKLTVPTSPLLHTCVFLALTVARCVLMHERLPFCCGT